MNITLWILQVLMAITFFYSGICKSLLTEKKLVAAGQTGVEGLNQHAIKFIGISEILGAIALIVPMCLHIAAWLTPVAAFCLALIMPFAARIHYKRKEFKNVVTNLIIFCVCMFIVYGRIALIKNS